VISDTALFSRRDELKMQYSNKICLSRRDCLVALPIALAASVGPRSACGAEGLKPKRVAVVATIYQPGSHADVLVGKILEGWKQDGGPGPALELASMYVEQFPQDDLTRPMAQKYDVPIFDSIEKAITLGGNTIPVDGVISIAEHGDYPFNERGQHLYPRQRFFKAVTDTFIKYKRVVPVFSDKHLGPSWNDAKWMYDRARKMKIPFMAGSSLPVSYRTPGIQLPMGCEIEAAVGIGYDGLDIYGSHALDSYQCIVERRRNAERGVRSVQYFEGDDAARVLNSGILPAGLVDTVRAAVPKANGQVPYKLAPREALFLFEYRDGLLGVQLMSQSVNRTGVAVKLKGHDQPLATQFDERVEPRHPHFAYLLKGIERMMHTGRPSYPVERTYLTSGILDRAIKSRALGGIRLKTPELAIRYQPVDYPHAPLPDLDSSPLTPLSQLLR